MRNETRKGMVMGNIELSDHLRRGLISSWHQFLEAAYIGLSIPV
jgi:hypothetical protein